VRIGRSWGEALLGLSCLLLAAQAAPWLAQSAAADTTAATPPAPAGSPDAPGSPRPAGAPRVASYVLQAKLDAETHVVSASGTIVWNNPSTLPARELYLHLYLNAFKNESSVFLRSPFGAGRSGERARVFGYVDIEKLSARELGGASLWPPKAAHTPDDLDDETSVRVDLPGEVPPGQTLTLDIQFKAQLPEIVERTGYAGSYHFVAQWFPKLAKREPDGRWIHFPFHAQSEFYADFGDYDVSLDVPAEMVVGATGERVSSETRKERRVDRYVARGVHDFAWTAWPDFVEAGERISGARVRLLYPPGHEHNRDVMLESLRFALPFFEKHYGAYPYPTLTVVHPPSAGENSGGMEYPTLITTGGPWFTAYTGARAIEAVTVHELGHQWFYGLLASDEHRYPLLDEGINTYAENRALHERYGDASVFSAMGLAIDGNALSRTFAAAREEDTPVALPAAEFPGFRTMAALVYSRTGTALETIARVFGRQRLDRALLLYAERFRFKNPAPNDLLDCVRSEVGEAAAVALRRALLERGTVDYVVREVQSVAETSPAGVFDRAGQRDTVIAESAPAGSRWLGRAVVYRHGSVELPVEVEFVDEGGGRTRQRWDGHDAFRVFQWSGSAPLVSVVVDPDGQVLLDGDLLNNAASSRPSSAWRVFERGTYALQLIQTWLLP